MKQILCFLGLLCLFFRVGAQENLGDRGVRVGALVPDVVVTGAGGVRVDGKELGGNFRFSALRGRMVILDYWATWCAPCRGMVPVMDSLQRDFGDSVLFLPVAYESRAVVAPVLAAMQRLHPFTLPGVTGDKVLNGLFPHRSLPHFVWVNGAGVVVAITEEKEVTRANIRRAIGGGGLNFRQKQDLVTAYDVRKPLLVGGNGGAGAGLQYHSLLSGYIPGLSGGMDISVLDSSRGQQFNVRNVPFTWLCRLAYGDHNRWFSNAMVRIYSADSANMNSRLSGQAFTAWLQQGNGWCYELLLPPALAGNAYGIMQQDLARLFPRYRVAVENTRTRCLVLLRTSAADKLHTAGGEAMVEVGPYACTLRNAGIGQLVRRLQVQYLQNARYPVIDGTGYAGQVDLSLRAPMYDIAALNLELARYDLRLVEQDAGADLLVIRDSGKLTRP